MSEETGAADARSREITVEAYDSGRLAAFRQEWARLHRLVPDALPFAHPAWYETWLAHFPQPGAIFLFIRRGGDLVGVVPLVVSGAAATGLGNPKIQDYTGAFAMPGREPDVARGLLGWLESSGVESFTFWGIPEGDVLAEAVASSAGTWTVDEEEEAIAPVAELGPDWEEFLASLSKHDRHELRRKLRNLEAAGPVGLEVISDADGVASTMDSLLEMMRESHEGKARFLSPEMESFFRDVAPVMAAAGPGRTWRLSLDGAVVAILLGFENHRTWFLYNSGYDPEYARLAVGLLSKALAMRAAIVAGRTRFDFLRGQEDYKRRLGGAERIVRCLRFARGTR